MRPISRRNLEKAVLKLFHRLGRPVHVGDLKKEFGVKTKASSKKKTSTERDLIARTLLHLFKAGRVCKSERVVRVEGYPVSPYARVKGRRVVNVRFYAPPEYAGEIISFELNGSSYALRFVDAKGVDLRPGLTKKQMVVEVLRESDSALTSNEILQAINEKYGAYEIKSKKDFYNATSSLMRAVLRKLLREGLHGRKIDGRWIWYYTEEQLERFQRRYVEEDYILRCVRDLVKSERCVPVTKVASMLHATPGEVAYKVRKTGKVIRVKVRITTDGTKTSVDVEVPVFSRDSLVRWLGVVVPCSENGFGYETMLVDLDSDWEEALKEEIRKSLSRIHIKTLIGYFYEKLVAKLFNHLCTSKELRQHPVLSRYVIPFVFRSERVVNVWTTMKGGRRGEFDVLIKGTFRAFDVMAGGKSFLDLVIPIESKYSVVMTEHVTSFDEKIRKVFGEARNVIPIMVGLAWKPDALSLAKRFGFMPLYFSSINNLLKELTGTEYSFRDEWKRVEEMLNKGELSLLELRRKINNLEIKYLFEELIEKRLGKTLREFEPIPQGEAVRIQRGVSLPVKPSGKEPSVPKPMLAHPARSIREVLSRHPVLAWEHKIDGIRMLAVKKDGAVRLFSRRGHDRTGMYPQIAVEVKQHFDGEDFILDGELLAIDDSWHPLTPQHLLRKDLAYRLRYYVFDVLRLDGEDVRDYSYEERRRLLEKRLRRCDALGIVDRIISASEAEVVEFFHEAKNLGHEGLVAKSLSSPYVSGRGHNYWFKYKGASDTLDLVVVGVNYSEKKDLRSLLLAAKRNGSYHVIGKVGTGFKREDIPALMELLRKYQVDSKPDCVVSMVEPEQWIKPGIVVEISHEGIIKPFESSSECKLRFPRFVRIREDKGLEDI